MRDARNWLTVELGELVLVELALGAVVADVVLAGEVVVGALVVLLVESEDPPWK